MRSRRSWTGSVKTVRNPNSGVYSARSRLAFNGESPLTDPNRRPLLTMRSKRRQVGAGCTDADAAELRGRVAETLCHRFGAELRA
jgi:hypothetical protein